MVELRQSSATATDPSDPILTRSCALEMIPTSVLLALADHHADPLTEVVWPGVGPVPDDLVDSLPASLCRRQAEAPPEVVAWLARGIIVRDDSTSTGRRLAGNVGGHGPPDDQGRVEIGFTVAAADRGNGLASEAAAAWFGWAHRWGASLACLRSEESNLGSLAVARRLGFNEPLRAWDEGDQIWLAVHERALPL